MPNEEVVKEDLTNPQPSEGKKQEEAKKEEIASPAPGSKTDSLLLLKSLQEEREKRRLLEEEKKLLEEELESSTLSEEDVISEEGKILKKQISTLTEKINSIEEEKDFEKLCNKYPILREKTTEFKEFRSSEHPKAKLESVAKLYLAENGLLEPVRKGLEKPTGGTRIPSVFGMTTEDVKRLRTSNYKKYL